MTWVQCRGWCGVVLFAPFSLDVWWQGVDQWDMRRGFFGSNGVGGTSAGGELEVSDNEASKREAHARAELDGSVTAVLAEELLQAVMPRGSQGAFVFGDVHVGTDDPANKFPVGADTGVPVEAEG